MPIESGLAKRRHDRWQIVAEFLCLYLLLAMPLAATCGENGAADDRAAAMAEKAPGSTTESVTEPVTGPTPWDPPQIEGIERRPMITKRFGDLTEIEGTWKVTAPTHTHFPPSQETLVEVSRVEGRTLERKLTFRLDLRYLSESDLGLRDAVIRLRGYEMSRQASKDDPIAKLWENQTIYSWFPERFGETPSFVVTSILPPRHPR